MDSRKSTLQSGLKTYEAVCVELSDAPESSYLEPSSRKAQEDGISGIKRMSLVMKPDYRWPNGKPIIVCFMDGDSKQHDFVVTHAKEWEMYGHITFKFVGYIGHKNSDIRISFKGKGSWSMVGTEALGIKEDKPTMNIDFNAIGPLQRKGVILHEFGHALGCLHEHSSPSANIAWDEAAVLRHYGLICQWSPADTRYQVLVKHDSKTVMASRYDNTSIMHYEVQAHLTKDGSSVNQTYELSEVDKAYIAKMYPKPEGHHQPASLLFGALSAILFCW